MRNFTYILFVLFLCSAGSAFGACDTDLPASTGHLTVDSTNKVVTDSKTGLMWKQCLEGDPDCSGGATSDNTFSDAVSAVNAANAEKFAGYENWRLPNIKELQSIVEEQCADPAFDLTAFPGTPATGEILSNSPKDGSDWRTINLSSGSTGSGTSGYVRLVRDIPTTP
jgi:hypothetical protein